MLFLLFNFFISYQTKAAALNTDQLLTEVQVAICEEPSAIEQKIELESWKLKRNLSTYFVENKDLSFYSKGWVFRIRKNNLKQKVDVTLKKNMSAARNIEQDNIPDGADCEYDSHGDQKKLSCKLNREISVSEFEEISSVRAWTDLLNSEQINWLKSDVGELPQNLEMTFDFTGPSYEKSGVVIDVDESHGRSFVEISERTNTNGISQVQKELLNFLAQHQLRVCNEENSHFTLRKLKLFFQL